MHWHCIIIRSHRSNHRPLPTFTSPAFSDVDHWPSQLSDFYQRWRISELTLFYIIIRSHRSNRTLPRFTSLSNVDHDQCWPSQLSDLYQPPVKLGNDLRSKQITIEQVRAVFDEIRVSQTHSQKVGTNRITTYAGKTHVAHKSCE